MKKNSLISILPIFAIILSGCSENIDNKNTIEKTSLSYSYEDVMNNFHFKASTTPNKGNSKLLVLPIWFTDSSSFINVDFKDDILLDLDKAFNATSEEIEYESVKSFYAIESRGKCSLDFKIANWIDVPFNMASYASNESQTSSRIKSLVDDYFVSSGENKNDYDTNKDGYLDGVIVIYASPDRYYFKGEEDLYSNMWAYTAWTMLEPNTTSPVVNNYLWASFDFMYSKQALTDKFGLEYGSGDASSNDIDAHTYIHEMGHMFGLVDYYDYSMQYKPAGDFSMQDQNVGGHDPYSLMALNWVEPYIPTSDIEIDLNDFQESGEVILLSNKFNDKKSPFDEYFLLEAYSSKGLNKFDLEKNKKYFGAPNDVGIRLWHVDARLIKEDQGRYSNIENATVMPNEGNSRVKHLMSNTYAGTYGREHLTPMGSTYANFNLLQLIRNDEIEDCKSVNSFDEYSLFKDGSKFNMNKFKNQFYNKGKLNDGSIFEWSFSVSINNEKIKLNLTRTEVMN